MKSTTASNDPQAYDKLKELIKDIDIAMVTTVTVEGSLRSRPMATRKFEDDGILWFFTADDSGKAHDLEQEHAVNVSYAEPKNHRYVSVTGSATVVHDKEMSKELWTPMVKVYFPGGIDDPHLALLSVRIESAEYWDASISKMVRLFTRSVKKGQAPELGENVKVDVRNVRSTG